MFIKGIAYYVEGKNHFILKIEEYQSTFNMYILHVPLTTKACV